MMDDRRKNCTHLGTKQPSDGVAGTTKADSCSGHAKDGMMDMKKKTCTHRGCTKRPSYGVAGTMKADFCSVHAKDGMVNVTKKRCIHRGCTKHPSYGVAGTTKADFCSGHAKDGMVNVRHKTCAYRGCTKRPSYGVAGTTKADFCSRHAKDGVVDDRSRRCAHRGCTIISTFCLPGKTLSTCAPHAEEGLLLLTGSTNQPGVHGVGGCVGHHDSGAVEDGNVPHVGTTRKRKRPSHSSSQLGIPPDRSGAASQRTRRVSYNAPGGPPPPEAAVDGNGNLIGDGSFSWAGAKGGAVKTEVTESRRTASSGAFPFGEAAGAAARERANLAGCPSSFVEPDGAMKAEVGISFRPRRASAGAGFVSRREIRYQTRAVQGQQDVTPKA